MEYIVIIVFFFITIPLALFLIFKPVMEDRMVRNNVRNFDSFMQNYCFALDCSQSEAMKQLSMPNVRDTLAYTLDTDHLIIRFSHLGASIEHQLFFCVVENRTYLKVIRVNFLHDKSNIPSMINRFFIEKIGAIPIDYTFFQSEICIS